MARRSVSLVGAAAVTATARSSSSSSCSPAAANLRVASYNVLSDNLCRGSHYVHALPEDLENEARYERVKAHIKGEMDKGSIICLQEVSRKWGGRLVPFLEENGYGYAAAPYGNPFNGYMGVALLWPRHLVSAEEVSCVRVADTVEWARPKGDWSCPSCNAIVFASKDKCFKCGTPKPKPVTATSPALPAAAAASVSALGRVWGLLASAAAAVAGSVVGKGSSSADVSGGRPQRPFDVWGEVGKRSNVAVMGRLRHKSSGQTFAVATYHMPCLFGSDEKCQVMVAHVSLLMQAAQLFAGGDPLVVAGDFNIAPNTPPYMCALNGSIDPEHPQCPPLPAPIVVKPTRSITLETEATTTTTTTTVDTPATTAATTTTTSAAGQDEEKEEWKLGFRAMRSAYAEASGTGLEEPEFTNFAWSAWDVAEPFQNTLDYIFLVDPPPPPSSTVKQPGGPADAVRLSRWAPVTSVKALPSKASVAHLPGFPTQAEPSDHVLIAADLTLLAA